MIKTAIIQARIGSARLPGKVMFPLDGRPVLGHVITRVCESNVTNVVVATSTLPPDDVIEQYAPEFGADVIRGSESDVLSRFERTVERYDPDIVVRVTADCPLVSPSFINASVQRIKDSGTEYVSAGLERTFPRGVTCEAFTAQSFKQMCDRANEPRHQEHVTPYYREHPDEFDLYNIESSELYDEKQFQNRTDLRLTLDEPADYQLLETVYRTINYQGILEVRDAINYIDRKELKFINLHVKQISV